MRKRRQYSDTGLYHIVIRGVNKQNIFYEDHDRILFIMLLKKYSKKLNIKIIAYCLMENHVHLELLDPYSNVSLFMQSVCSLYARRFNKKYDRIGHLFQERFLSETIKDDKYLIDVFRYILQNPEKAGICITSEFKWSSYHLYKRHFTFIYKDIITSYFGSIDAIYNFLKINQKQNFLELELRPSERERNYIESIMNLLQSESPLISPEISKIELQDKLRRLKRAKIPIRVISRITGISKYLVQKA